MDLWPGLFNRRLYKPMTRLIYICGPTKQSSATNKHKRLAVSRVLSGSSAAHFSGASSGHNRMLREFGVSLTYMRKRCYSSTTIDTAESLRAVPSALGPRPSRGTSQPISLV